MDRLVLKTMAVDSPKAQIFGGKAAIGSQRVEDNAFHLGQGVDRLVLKTMAVDSPKAQISGGKAAIWSQRVEDNAFHLGV